MWPQAEARTLVGGFMGQWEAEDIAQFLWPDPRRAMWPQAEAPTLVDILIQKPCRDATRFTKFAERGFPSP